MYKKRMILLILCLCICSNTKVFAKSTGLQDLQDLPTAEQTAVAKSSAITPNHWAYKSLENISRKYGLLVGKPGETFQGNRPLTRNEAAIVLVNLTGKIEQDRAQTSEAEKVQLDILKQEFSQEIAALAGRVATLETSVDSLKGSVTKLESSDSKTFKSGGFGNNFKISGGLQARYNGVFNKGGTGATTPNAANFSIPISDFTVSSNLNKHVRYLAQLFPMRSKDTGVITSGNTTGLKGIMGDAYLATDIIPHNNIFVGQSRIPVGSEGCQSPYTLDMIDRAQVSRNFADLRDVGVKIAGNYPFMDYYAGIFNGNHDNYADSNNSLEYAGWIQFKPLYKWSKYGVLELGGGYDVGKARYVSYADPFNQNTTSFMASYKYKKYAIKGEYLKRNGYQGARRKADGYYINNSYFLTKRLQLEARIDQFNTDPGLAVTGTPVAYNSIVEYTGGLNYYFRDNNLKLQLDFVHVQNKISNDSNRIEIMTQYLL